MGKEKQLSLGTYPAVGLKEARRRRSEAKELLASDVDPSLHRKAVRAARAKDNENTFAVIAREWHAQQVPRWTERHAGRVMDRLEKDLFPYLGMRPIREITAPELLAVLRKKEDAGSVYSARRLRQIADQVFRYGIATGRVERNPAPDLQGALKAHRKIHRAAMTDPREVAGLLRAIDAYQGSIITRSALRLAPLVFVRPKELRMAEWAEIDLAKAEWSIPAEKMKMREAHLVPLSRQAIEIIEELQPLTGSGRYLFPNPRSPKRPMSDNAILAALRRMGIGKEEMSGHGFRAMARTLLDEVLGVRPDFIEHQLAHAVRDPNGRAYNRKAHLDAPRKMMQDWANYLDDLRRDKV